MLGLRELKWSSDSLSILSPEMPSQVLATSAECAGASKCAGKPDMHLICSHRPCQIFATYVCSGHPVWRATDLPSCWCASSLPAILSGDAGSRGAAATRRTGEVQSAQVSPPVGKRICKRDAAEEAEPGETCQLWRDEQSGYAEVSQLGRDRALRLGRASHCS